MRAFSSYVYGQEAAFAYIILFKALMSNLQPATLFENARLTSVLSHQNE
jgi:hypothetical protein